MFGLKIKKIDIIFMLIAGIIVMAVIFFANMKAKKIIFDEHHPGDQKILKPIEGDFVIGQSTAPVEVVFYGDFTCYHCMRFVKENFERLRDKYIFTGKVQFIFRPVVSSKRTLFGSKFLFCDKRDDNDNADIFWNMFENKWMLKNDYLNALLQLARKKSWSTSEHFQQCVSSKEIEENLRELYQNTVVRLKIHGTPHLFINQKPASADKTMFYLIDKEYKYIMKNK